MNIPAITCALRTLAQPTLILPHATIPHLFNLPVPISRAFSHTDSKDPDIRAVILDKDNTFALPKSNAIDPSCSAIITSLLNHYGRDHLLIVSNTAGLSSADPNGSSAALLEKETGIPVLRHSARKPSAECGQQALAHFKERRLDVKPEQVAVVGDRLLTDVVMSKGMGAWSVWIKEGVKRDTGLWTKGEVWVEQWLRGKGLSAGRPGK